MRISAGSQCKKIFLYNGYSMIKTICMFVYISHASQSLYLLYLLFILLLPCLIVAYCKSSVECTMMGNSLECDSLRMIYMLYTLLFEPFRFLFCVRVKILACCLFLCHLHSCNVVQLRLYYCKTSIWRPCDKKSDFDTEMVLLSSWYIIKNYKKFSTCSKGNVLNTEMVLILEWSPNVVLRYPDVWQH